ncbi:MAG: hypothetical protein KAS21_05665, partial [Candidatus Aminicenantes bacterium]|nr:hypothetical protein [Candidatus Aminicenantes bacterium]
ITKHFKMILPVDDLEIKVNMLIREKRFKRFKNEENDRYKKEYQFIGNFKKVFSLLKNKKNMRFGLQSVLNDLRVRYLLNLDKKKKRSFNSYWAKRLLYEIAIKANRFSFIYSDKKDEKRAILFGELAVGTEVNKNLYNFRLASIYAVFGKKKRCIKIIKPLLKEVDNLMDFIEKDPNFNELLKDPDFMSVFINK